MIHWRQWGGKGGGNETLYGVDFMWRARAMATVYLFSVSSRIHPGCIQCHLGLDRCNTGPPNNINNNNNNDHAVCPRWGAERCFQSRPTLVACHGHCCRNSLAGSYLHTGLTALWEQGWWATWLFPFYYSACLTYTDWTAEWWQSYSNWLHREDGRAGEPDGDVSCDGHVRRNGPPLSPGVQPSSWADADRPVGSTRDNTRGMWHEGQGCFWTGCTVQYGLGWRFWMAWVAAASHGKGRGCVTGGNSRATTDPDEPGGARGGLPSLPIPSHPILPFHARH